MIADSQPRFDPSETVAGARSGARGRGHDPQQNAEDQGIEIGDEIGIATRHGIRPVTVVGRLRVRRGRLGLRRHHRDRVTRSEVERLFDLEGRVIDDRRDRRRGRRPGRPCGPDRRGAAALGPRPDGDARAPTRTRTRSTIRSASFLTPALLALAGAAVLVGAFIIFNTFSITVAQRMREFAMLRALGATRRQILAIVAAEALGAGPGCLGPRHRRRDRGSPSCSTASSTRSGSASRAPGSSSRRGRSRSRSGSGSA